MLHATATRLQAFAGLEECETTKLRLQAILDNEWTEFEFYSAQHAQQADHAVSLCFASHSSSAGLNAVQVL